MGKLLFDWKPEDVEYLINNWGKESAHSMKKRFNCSWLTVANKAKSLGLPEPVDPTWTDEEIDTLAKLAKQGVHYKKIADIMDKSPTAIYLKAKRLDIQVRQDKKEWSEEDVELLMDKRGVQNLKTIAEKLQRSETALKTKAYRMNMGAMLDNQFDWSISNISENIGVSRDRIMTWAKKGLNLRKLKATSKRSYYVVSEEDLINFLKNNLSEWDSRDVEFNTFGVEAEESWLKEKRRMDRISAPIKRRDWTKSELMRAINLFDLGKTYAEIAKELDRSEGAVTDKLRDSGLSFRMAKFWQEKEIEYLEENYKEKTYKEIAEQLNRSDGAVSEKARSLGLSKTKK